jgi:hypothetical protein
LTDAVFFEAVTRLRLLLIAFAALIGLRETSAGPARFQGFPTRQRLVIYAVPNPPAEPIVKLPQPVAPGTDKNHLALPDGSLSAVVTIEKTSTIEAGPKAPLEKSEADLEAEARKGRIKAERERLNHNAVVWQQERAAGGSPMAQRSLAMRYFTGDGVEKDEVKGMDFLRKAAAGGDSAAMKELAKREPAKKE